MPAVKPCRPKHVPPAREPSERLTALTSIPDAMQICRTPLAWSAGFDNRLPLVFRTHVERDKPAAPVRARRLRVLVGRRPRYLAERDAFIALIALSAAVVALVLAVVWALGALVRLPVTIVRWLAEGCRASWRYIRDPDSRRTDDEAAVSLRDRRVRRRLPTAASMLAQTVVAHARRRLLALGRGVVFACSLAIVAAVFLPRWLVLLPRGMLVLRRRRRAYARSRASSSRSDRAGLFLSYRTAQHQAAHAVRDVLVGRGFTVWLDDDRGVLPSQTLGLDAVLEKAIRGSDLVVVVQGADPAPPARRGWADEVDALLAVAVRVLPACFVVVCALSALPFLLAAWVFAPIAVATDHRLLQLRPWLRTFLRAVAPAPAVGWWYRTLYHVEILPRPDEPWQGWERRIAELFGVPVVDAHITYADGASRRKAGALPSTAVVLRATRLEEDVSTRLVPRIETTTGIAVAPLAAANARFRDHVVGGLDSAAEGGPASMFGWLFGGWLRTLTTARSLLVIEH